MTTRAMFIDADWTPPPCRERTNICDGELGDCHRCHAANGERCKFHNGAENMRCIFPSCSCAGPDDYPQPPRNKLQPIAKALEAQAKHILTSSQRPFRDPAERIQELLEANNKLVEEKRAALARLKVLETFRDQVVNAAGSLEGLPDGHGFEIIWMGEDDDEEGNLEETSRDGFITAGMIRRAQKGE